MSLGTQIIEIEEENSSGLPFLEISEESSIGIGLFSSSESSENSKIVIDDFGWKTLPRGKQVMIRTGGPRELNGNDMRKIKIAVNLAVAAKTTKERNDIRNKLLANSGISPKRIEGVNELVENAVRNTSGNLQVMRMNSVLSGMSVDKALSDIPHASTREIYKKYTFSDEGVRANAISRQFNRQVYNRMIPEKNQVAYRGVRGRYAAKAFREARKSSTNKVSVNSNPLFSVSHDKKLAAEFADTKKKNNFGIVLKGKASAKSIFDSHLTHSRMDNQGDKELLLGTGKHWKTEIVEYIDYKQDKNFHKFVESEKVVYNIGDIDKDSQNSFWMIKLRKDRKNNAAEVITNDYVEIDERFLPLLEISEESSIGIEFLDDNDSIIIDHDWKTIKGKQILIRKGNAGALNGNDMRKINIAVKAASANPGQMDQIRETLVGGYIPDVKGKPIGWRQHRSLTGGTDSWVSSSNSLEAGQMAVANNVMKGRERHVGLTPRQLRGVKRDEEFGEKYPDTDMLKAVNVQAQFNRGMAKEKFGSKPFTVYRGIYGEQAIAIKARAKKGDTIRMNSNSLTSFTTSKDVATKFKNSDAGKTGIMIQTKVSYKNVFDSHASSSALKRGGFDEVIVAPKGMKITGVIIDG